MTDQAEVIEAVREVVREARQLWLVERDPRESVLWRGVVPRLEEAERALDDLLDDRPSDGSAWSLWREVRHYLGRQDPRASRG